MKKPKSLRLRLFALAVAVMVVAMVAAGIGLTALFTRHLERRVGQELDTHLQLLAGGLRVDDAGVLSLAREPADPRFSRVLGGLYWQIGDAASGRKLVSRSLWDGVLELPQDELANGAVHTHETTGPDGSRLLVHEREIVVKANALEHKFRISVAIDRSEILQLGVGFARDLVPALGILGAVLLLGFAFQVGAGLRPLGTVQDALGAVRSGRVRRLQIDVPREVEPLVSEVNSLLEAQENEMIRARDRAADLAHGLKTPLTALSTSIQRLRAKGEIELANEIDGQAERIRRHIERELARARVRHGRPLAHANVAACVGAIVRALVLTPDGERLTFEQNLPADMQVSVDIDDLNEILGNLLENATRHARSLVRIGAVSSATQVNINVEDDGEGLSDESRAKALLRGVRLDSTGTGAGLGLAIAQDIVVAYGGELELSRSPLGGLSASARLPAEVSS
jgi:signal transduction histidine kinase